MISIKENPLCLIHLDDVSAFIVEITAAHVSGGTAYHTFFVVATAGCKVYWGDGASSTLTTGTNTCTHTYAASGHYLVQIRGAHTRFYHGGSSTASKVVEGIKAYSLLTSLYASFSYCNNPSFKLRNGFSIPAYVTDIQYMLYASAIKALPTSIKIPKNVTIWRYFMADSLFSGELYDSFFPLYDAGTTVYSDHAFLNAKPTGQVPASKLWNRSDLTWRERTGGNLYTFQGCTTLGNYSSIPTDWK